VQHVSQAVQRAAAIWLQVLHVSTLCPLPLLLQVWRQDVDGQ
jgi:hypothetical protein